MKFKKIIYNAIIAALAGFTTTGCSDFLKEHSQDLAKVETWADLDEVLLGGAYVKTGRIVPGENYNGPSMDSDFSLDILHLMSDEIEFTDEDYNDYVGYRTDYYAFYTWQPDLGMDYQNRYIANDSKFWTGLYERINVCNMVLSLIDDQPQSTQNDAIQKKRVKGEAYYLRGLFYFTLANLYCEPYAPSTAGSKLGVPVKTTEYVEDIEFNRGNLAETYQQILSDLTAAEECLKDVPSKSIYRADVNAVRLLLSRVYLYMQDWDKAIAYSKQVIADHGSLLDLRSIVAEQNSVSATSPETILSMGDYNVAVAFADTRYDIAAHRVSEEMYDKYTNADLRKTRYVGSTANRKGPRAFLKFNGQNTHWGSYSDYGSVFSLRSPEAYLTLAEASAYKGDENTARETLKKFLATRMSGTVTVEDTGNDLLDFIREERAREFILEGHRWFDLRRYSVNETHPWSVAIDHKYPIYDGRYFDHYDVYRLEPFDVAYTLTVPRDVINQQVSLGTVVRPARPAYDTEY